MNENEVSRVRLYETRTREMRELEPMDGETFRFYCCGPTVYGPAHVGNFRTFVLQDVFRRTLELSGMATTHVRNVTDVDDKTIRDSQAANENLGDFTDRWLKQFRADADALNCLPPHVEPSAVEHIPHQISMIKTLIEKGHAYEAKDGSVYFRVESYSDYGSLSHLDSREITSSGAALDSDEYEKDSISDFALWKAKKDEDGDNFWNSPWGFGRPGWHLECSAMSLEYLGADFDLHSGGIDLIFPHHDNEIAQSCCATGGSFAQHWFHVAHLMVDGGKMSKSLGNLYTLADLEERGFTANELRYALISGKYRQPLNFTFSSLEDARVALKRLSKMESALREVAGRDARDIMELREAGIGERFAPGWAALREDLNTPGALGGIFSGFKGLDPSALSANEAGECLDGLTFLMNALGLVFTAAEEKAETVIPEAIQLLAEQRIAAKAEKDWAAADRLRDEIAAAGFVITDTAEGYEIAAAN